MACKGYSRQEVMPDSALASLGAATGLLRLVLPGTDDRQQVS